MQFFMILYLLLKVDTTISRYINIYINLLKKKTNLQKALEKRPNGFGSFCSTEREISESGGHNENELYHFMNSFFQLIEIRNKLSEIRL